MNNLRFLTITIDDQRALCYRPLMNHAQCSVLYNKAHTAGMAAGTSFKPAPMVVQTHADPLTPNSPVVASEVVSEGVCGFAWITVRPGNCSFANWLKKNHLARPAYRGGVDIWVYQFNQSMQRKEAYADAFAKVLVEAGINAYAGSRMD